MALFKDILLYLLILIGFLIRDTLKICLIIHMMIAGLVKLKLVDWIIFQLQAYFRICLILCSKKGLIFMLIVMVMLRLITCLMPYNGLEIVQIKTQIQE